ncbi:unnamed protein product, partial [Linum tenue]
RYLTDFDLLQSFGKIKVKSSTQSALVSGTAAARGTNFTLHRLIANLIMGWAGMHDGQLIEEEEVKSLRKKMVPRAQLMPFFDRPFFPQRSNRALTMPKQRRFNNTNCMMSCVSENEMFHFHRQPYY